jgi:hypothetical protein
MRLKSHAILLVLLLLLFSATAVFASDPAPPAKKLAVIKKAAKAKAAAAPTVEEQIQALRQALAEQGRQIDSLKNDLSDEDARLKKAEQSAADAEAAVARVQAAAAAEGQVLGENAAAVTTLQSAVTDIKTDQTTLAVQVAKVTSNVQAPPNATEPGAPAVVATAPSKTINEALVPVRVFPVGAINARNIHPTFEAEGVGFVPYGFIKATGVFDSSDPTGDDFPLPGFGQDSGPNGAPEFHLKTRSTRFGSNFYWHDSNPKWVITGKVEGDFEGNFNRSDNRNVSTIRSSNPSIRVAWARMDYNMDEGNSVSALFGQDWTTFGSSTLPNILETTGLGIYFGTLYERDPQMRAAFTHKAGGFSIMPEFAIDLPASGIPPAAADLYYELGYGERQGPDSDRPNYQSRIVAQWQLDPAPGVAPAQIILSGFNGRRTAVVTAASIPAAYQATFPTGATASSKEDGWDAEYQLPTRFFTLVGKYYSGSDLRWFFAGQEFSYYSDTTGLVAADTVSATAEDGNTVSLGTTTGGQQEVVPERPVRAQGGFVQLGLPLSRIFNANPAGRNAGWSLYGLYGVDQAKSRDELHAAETDGGYRHASTMAIGTLNYKFSKWVSFSYEESLFTTHANTDAGVSLPIYRGVHSREWNDIREEFGPVFVF